MFERIEKATRTTIVSLGAGAAAAFCAYFSMYAFRKPFAAATFADQPALFFDLDYKTTLLIAQVLGYALSKLIGIRMIAEFGRTGRAGAILTLIGISWLALILFGAVPAPWNIGFLFLNGLPLGMIWGLVFSYVEGRRASEAMGALLCASFILSSGVVKSVAILVMDWGVGEFWMPAVTGALFFPLLLLSLWLLERMPPPDDRDIAERTARVPMRARERASFLRNHGVAMLLLVSGYVLLTAIRDFRDNFAAELWIAMGQGGIASVFSASELPVMIVALTALGALTLIRDNMRALLAMHGIILIGALLLGLSTLAFQHGWLAPFSYMILTGAGLYLAYTPFNAMLFDRMIAALGHVGNAGFLIYIADSSGYVGSVALLLYRSLAAPSMDWLSFYISCAYLTAIAVAVLTVCSAAWFHFHVGKHHVRPSAA
ncbi:hypothetical protein SKP52_20475 [Sphingopyxis fribergensis]|uniref:MFS transporter n=1 Tax=Sphingopyxis fribergensis TaxID=1515612 RepID=A0A0A7PLS7_9SPHN|nr:DUF5690 family protein [Sphingopyxis fribergensis]AJA10960.1 hypothetical protein SKP52_20475 [Sphingopyxis fribergensis]